MSFMCLCAWATLYIVSQIPSTARHKVLKIVIATTGVALRAVCEELLPTVWVKMFFGGLSMSTAAIVFFIQFVGNAWTCRADMWIENY